MKILNVYGIEENVYSKKYSTLKQGIREIMF